MENKKEDKKIRGPILGVPKREIIKEIIRDWSKGGNVRTKLPAAFPTSLFCLEFKKI